MKIFILLLALVTVIETKTADEEDECVPPADAPQLDVLFLVDRSSSKVIKALPRLIKIIDDINNEYRRPRFALSYYSDFQCSNYFKYEICNSYRLEDNLPHHADPEGCYTFNTSLSKDITRIKDAASNIEQLPSGNDESAVAALMMGITDKNIKWSSNNTNNVIFVITDAAPNYGPMWSQQIPPRGDGTDRCKTMDNPSVEFTAEILKKNFVTLFLLLADSNAPQDTFKVWRDVINKMGIKNAIGKMSDSNERIFEQFNKFMNTCNA